MPILFEDRNNIILQVTPILKNNIITTQFFYYLNFFIYYHLSVCRLKYHTTVFLENYILDYYVIYWTCVEKYYNT